MDESQLPIPSWLLHAISLLLDQSPDGIHILDQTGTLIYANQTFLRMLGYDPSDPPPCHVREWDARWAADELTIIVADLIANGRSFLTKHRCVDGRQYDASINVSTIINEGQSYLFCTVRDVSEQCQREETLRESEERFRTIFFEDRSIKLLIDPQTGRIADANQAAIDFYGYPYVRLTQMKVQEINQLPYEVVEAEMRRAVGRSKNHFNFQHRLASGEIRDVEVYSNTVWIKSQSYLLSFIHDVTEGKRAEAALRESEMRYREMFDLAPFAIAHSLPDGTFLDVNLRFAQLFGYQSRAEFLAAVLNGAQLYANPARRSDIWEQFQNNQAHFTVESSYQRCDGTEFVGRISVQIIRQSNGQVAYIESFIEDITARKQIEQELQAEHDFALTVMNAMGQGLTVTDVNGFFEYVNPAYAQFMGYKTADLINKRPGDLTSPESLLELQYAREARQSGKMTTYESRLIHADGTLLDVLITGTPRWRDGKVVGVIAVITDLSERKRIEAELRHANTQLNSQMETLRELQAQLHEQTIRDPLTGLYNRRYLNESLPREIVRARRLEHTLAVLMLDIDHFKLINDTYGHVAGDETLQSIATLIQSRLRASDIACRYGGEEMLCVLLDTDLEHALSLADNLCHAIANQPILLAYSDVRVTISIGVAIWPQSGLDMNAVVQAADMALYRAKQNGRNRVCVGLNDSDME